jgi:hypothetical protein
LQSCQAPRDNDRVEDIDTEAPLFEQHIVSALEARDRRCMRRVPPRAVAMAVPRIALLQPAAPTPCR